MNQPKLRHRLDWALATAVVVSFTPAACASHPETNNAAGLEPLPEICPSGIVTTAAEDTATSFPVIHALFLRAGRDLDPSSVRLIALPERSELRNRSAVQRALVKNYPRQLRDAGLGGETLVALLVDENGAVLTSMVSRASEYSEIDQASLAVVNTMEFAPAVAEGCRAPYAAQIPIVWSSK